jgi:integrase
MTITLRQRDKGKKISLYLDIYDAGKRKYEYLKLYIKKEPTGKKLSAEEKKENRESIIIAESIRIKRIYELQRNRYKIDNLHQNSIKLIDYIQEQIKTEEKSKSNVDILKSVVKHIKEYDKLNINISSVSGVFLEGFKAYLKNTAQTTSGTKLSPNTQSIYFMRLKNLIVRGCKSGVIINQEVLNVKQIRQIDTQIEYLTLEELQMLKKTRCKLNVIKKSFLFMSLTGLRFSDASRLKYEDIKKDSEGKIKIRYRQKKTNRLEVLPVCLDAYKLIQNDIKISEYVFEGLKYSSYYNSILKEWVKAAGITKKIGFHSARHTFATLNITSGNDIYVISKLLGHKSVKTTERYAKIIDRKKEQAIEKLAI